MNLKARGPNKRPTRSLKPQVKITIRINIQLEIVMERENSAKLLKSHNHHDESFTAQSLYLYPFSI